jgi:hypothetical protein
MLTLREILRGCEAGRIQTLQSLQIIPLLTHPGLQEKPEKNIALDIFDSKARKNPDRNVLNTIEDFELVENQVGAIFLINGSVVSITKAPCSDYWEEVWTNQEKRSYAYLCERRLTTTKFKFQGVQNVTLYPYLYRTDLGAPKGNGGSSLHHICEALERAEAEQEKIVNRYITELPVEPFVEERQETVSEAVTVSLSNDRFAGKAILGSRTWKILAVNLWVKGYA